MYVLSLLKERIPPPSHCRATMYSYFIVSSKTVHAGPDVRGVKGERLMWWKHCLNSCSRFFVSSLQLFLHCVDQTSFLPQPPNVTSGILLPEPICHELHGVLPGGGGRKNFLLLWVTAECCRVSWGLGRDFNVICRHVALWSLHELAMNRNCTRVATQR